MQYYCTGMQYAMNKYIHPYISYDDSVTVQCRTCSFCTVYYTVWYVQACAIFKTGLQTVSGTCDTGLSAGGAWSDTKTLLSTPKVHHCT